MLQDELIQKFFTWLTKSKEDKARKKDNHYRKYVFEGFEVNWDESRLFVNHELVSDDYFTNYDMLHDCIMRGNAIRRFLISVHEGTSAYADEQGALILSDGTRVVSTNPGVHDWKPHIYHIGDQRSIGFPNAQILLWDKRDLIVAHPESAEFLKNWHNPSNSMGF
jgi:hypothetical protein